jgi:hypothetical protein
MKFARLDFLENILKAALWLLVVAAMVMAIHAQQRPEDQIPPIRPGLNTELWKLATETVQDFTCVDSKEARQRWLYEFAKEAARVQREQGK